MFNISTALYTITVFIDITAMIDMIPVALLIRPLMVLAADKNINRTHNPIMYPVKQNALPAILPNHS